MKFRYRRPEGRLNITTYYVSIHWSPSRLLFMKFNLTMQVAFYIYLHIMNNINACLSNLVAEGGLARDGGKDIENDKENDRKKRGGIQATSFYLRWLSEEGETV